MDPIALRLGPLAVHWYGIIIVVATLVGAYVASLEARRRGQDPDHVWDALLLCLILGIIGARLYHVFSSPQGGMLGWDYYRQHPIAILQIWHGGLAIYGAVVGGILAVYIYARLKQAELLAMGGHRYAGPHLGPSPSGAGATSSIRSFMAILPTCPGASLSPPLIASLPTMTCPCIRLTPASTPLFSTSRCGTCWDFSC